MKRASRLVALGAAEEVVVPPDGKLLEWGRSEGVARRGGRSERQRTVGTLVGVAR